MRADIPVQKDTMIVAKAIKQGDPNVQVYVVGGAVRDWLFHHFHGQPGSTFRPKDEDLTTNLSEEEILARLRSPFALAQGIRVKEKESVDTFGVVFASVQGGMAVEVAPFRKDIGSADGRRPERVERGDIHDDAMRRDLTMNNLYYDFEQKVIIDVNPNGQGVEDVRNGVARPVGDPFERFDEDKLRVLRLVRFFSRFNPGSIIQKLDERTLAAIKKFKKLQSFAGITPERIETEFLAGVKQSQNTASFLRNLAELDLYQAVFPGMRVENDFDRLGNTKNIRVILAWMLRHNNNAESLLNQIKYPNEISEPVQFLINAMNFGVEQAADMVRNRDRRLLKVGKKRTSLSPEEEARNNQIVQEMRGDLTELSRILGASLMPHETERVHRMQHLAQYEPPSFSGEDLMKQGFKGAAIGAEQKRLSTDHYAQSFQDYIQKRSGAHSSTA